MDSLDGMELAVLRKPGNGTTVILIFSNRKIALRDYETSTLRHLLKPVEKEKLREPLKSCQQHFR